jgi:glycosyltransferase involved in cell wall biosynthesis
MTTILYIGNNLKTKTSNLSSIQLLGGLLESEGYTIFYASNKRNKVLRLLDMVYCFFRYQRQVDYVLIDTYSTHNFYYALLISQLCRIFKKPYIPNLNGGNLPVRLKNHPFLSSLIFKYAYVNVSPSAFLREAFEGYGYCNVIYIPNTIEIKYYDYMKKDAKQLKLLWVRSFSKIYNPLLAVRVLKALIAKGYPASLCMVGPDADGSLKAVKQLAKLLKVPVKFPGKLEKPVWIALATDYSIFINTTNFDNTPVSVIEAMALGLPVVSTNVGGMPYLIDHGKDGLLVEPDDVEQMVDAILELHKNNSLAETMARKARLKVEQFDWEVVKYFWFEILS